MNSLKVYIRTDASLEIGTGHVMRCITLAEKLLEFGTTCKFICRSHPGNLIDVIREKGFETYALPSSIASANGTLTNTVERFAEEHTWLGADFLTDANKRYKRLERSALIG